VKLADVIEELVEERGLERSILSSIICEGILAAYKKKYPELPLAVSYDRKSDEMSVTIEKKVVSKVQDEELEISLRKAQSIKKSYELDDMLQVPFEGSIGRIEIMRAKQIIASKIREIEASAIYNEFKDKAGEIIVGTVHKCERNGVAVKIGDNDAFLPNAYMIPDDKCVVGMPIRALLKEVLPEPRYENQLILDRTSPEFLKKLFELEIPEMFEKLIEVKKIVRTPGYKSKVVVISHDKNIDPVGTCVGVGGVRIKPILKELNNEKIDVITQRDSVEDFIRDALKPAMIDRVELTDDANATVWLPEDQRSLAIGKLGQNIQLASQLTGVNLHLAQAAVSQVVEDDEEEEDMLGAEDSFTDTESSDDHEEHE
jgi:transcription termination/antitermination protein NusA